MSTFTKTIIVDLTHDVSEGEYYKTIADATNYFIKKEIGGKIIIETGEYILDGTYEEKSGNIINDKRTIFIPLNTTLIGRGNVVVKVTNPSLMAFANAHWTDGDNHITLSGFKIIVASDTGPYSEHLIRMQNVSDSIIEKIYIEAPINDNPRGVNPEKFAILFYSNGHDCARNKVIQCVIKNYGTADPVLPGYNYGNGIGFTRNISPFICCDSIVKNNYVSECFFNLTITDAQRMIVQGNILSRATGQISVVHPAWTEVKNALNISLGACTDVIIRGNQCNETDSTTGAHGIYPSGCERVVISGNVVCGNRDCGIKPRFTGTNIVDNYYSEAA